MISQLLLTSILAVSTDGVHDVAYWKANKQALEAKIAECKNNPAIAQNDGNCINAFAARSELNTEKILNAKENPFNSL